METILTFALVISHFGWLCFHFMQNKEHRDERRELLNRNVNADLIIPIKDEIKLNKELSNTESHINKEIEKEQRELSAVGMINPNLNRDE